MSTVAAPVDSQQAQIQHLLHEGRARIHAGDIGGALKCAVAALEAAGGQHMVLPSLREAMRKWHEGTVAAADVSDLSSLLAAISLDPPQFAATAEAPAVPRTDGRAERAHSSPQASPILAETGRAEIADMAMSDGSSYTCPRCGGIVPVVRRHQHEQWWCQLPGA
uniref:C2HC zinc finger plants domain-containing protein n=1 Tax=Tetraselmis sp. GSL018 TaxID=582737 RepID=A0A061RXN9_9CHLO|mmetsp:Transcript_41713/g.98960  ORF Transcript_41713/g.98960 Transcript_41713/m.98960 type:complete len:165 (-) Transcript_41713:145-639(-)